MTKIELTRRRFLTLAGTVGAGLVARGATARAAGGRPEPPPCGAGLSDIDHVVILMDENRSFDHYFGTYPDVRGFADRRAIDGVFAQATARTPSGVVYPYHLDTSVTGKGECTPDPGHGWGTQHQSWAKGAMNAWGAAHAGDSDLSFIGYYTRQDLPYYYAVADAFTLCDSYFCSVMGSTTSNRLYSVSAWLDPLGTAGGPVTSTINWAADPTHPRLSWETYPERLTKAGVSWRAYSSPDADGEENPLVNFKQFYPGNPGYRSEYTEAVFGHTYADFLTDAAAGNLPQVSWVLTSIVDDEHPSGAPQSGEFALQEVIHALTANSAAWAKTALIWTYDENGGFFDHVSPPTPDPGTSGETIPSADPNGPIGFGFRVPTLIVSPFSRGGFVARDQFDHTSTLRFLEARFGVEVAHLTPWRRAAAGDLTSAFNFAAPDFSIPDIHPRAPMAFVDHPECATEEVTMDPGPDPASTAPPPQEAGYRRSPSGPC